MYIFNNFFNSYRYINFNFDLKLAKLNKLKIAAQHRKSPCVQIATSRPYVCGKLGYATTPFYLPHSGLVCTSSSCERYSS